jgi:hypothetical protein
VAGAEQITSGIFTATADHVAIWPWDLFLCGLNPATAWRYSAIAFSVVREMRATDSLIEAEECPSRRLGLRGPFGFGFDRWVPDKVFVDDLGKHQRHMQCLVAAMGAGGE